MNNKILIKLYVPCIDMEYELFIPTNESLKKIIELFGENIVENHQLNRQKLAQIIYSDSDKKNSTQTIVINEVNQSGWIEIYNDGPVTIYLDSDTLFKK